MVEVRSSPRAVVAVPPLDLCFELGYQEGIEYLPSRGPPKLLLDDLKAFLEDRQSSESVESLSAAYLAAKPAGLKHEAPENARHSEWLSWPRDRLIITHLVSQLVTYIIESHTPQTQIVDLTGDEVSEPEEAGVPFLGHHDQNRIDSGPPQVSTIKIAGPITRLHLRDPAMISSLQTAGFSEPFPVTTSNEQDLIQILERWARSHPNEDPPASRKFVKSSCGRKFDYAKELTFGCTCEPVWVERVRITAYHMAFFLTDDDGSCMLVDANHANNNGWRGYHGWLGADLGFTLQTIAQTEFSVEWHPESLIEDMYSENSGGRGVADVPQLSELVGEQQSVEKTVSIRSGTTKAGPKVTIKKEPRRTSTRLTDVRRNQLEHQTENERWRYETPPLSSLGVIKKRRWPAQYVSPPPTPQSKSHLQRGKKKPKAPKSSIPPSSRHQRCSSPGLGLIGPENAQPGNLDGNSQEKSKGRPRKKACKAPADTPQMPVSPISPFSLAPVTRAIPEPAPKSNVTFHFFLQRRELGALPTPLAQCDTTDKFFDHAEEAWSFLTSRDEASEMGAVSVEVEGVQWPMIIPWRDPLAHQWMMETIDKVAIGRLLDLHVQVKCITK